MAEYTMTLEDPSRISTLSDSQEIVLSLLFVFSGLMSMFGSFTIIYRVVRSPKRKTYDRIMLGLSFSDIVASSAYVLTPFLLPKETSQRLWASGTVVTCSVLGWLTQLGFAAIWYNGMLSYYYLATLRFAVSTEDFAARFEPYIHSLTPFYFLFTATAGVPFHMFTEFRLGMGCWIGEYPAGCDARGDCLNNIIGWLFAGFPLIFTFLSLAINNVVIYRHVKKLLTTGNSHTSTHELHIRRVATQGFLYVATFFIAYTPQFTLRILGANFGYRAADEAGIFWLLALNSLLLPLQGLFNMFIYTRPSFLRLKSAGASNLVALRGACFESDIPKYMSQTMGVASSAAIPSQKMRHSRLGSQAGQLPVSNKPINASDDPFDLFEIVSEEDSTSEEPNSSENGGQESPTTQRSVLKKKSSRMQMDGSIERSHG